MKTDDGLKKTSPPMYLEGAWVMRVSAAALVLYNEWRRVQGLTPPCEAWPVPLDERVQVRLLWEDVAERALSLPGGEESFLREALRGAGWDVAVHNDHLQGGVPHIFWLFTQATSGRFAKGEGESDLAALREAWKDACRG